MPSKRLELVPDQVVVDFTVPTIVRSEYKDDTRRKPIQYPWSDHSSRKVHVQLFWQTLSHTIMQVIGSTILVKGLYVSFTGDHNMVADTGHRPLIPVKVLQPLDFLIFGILIAQCDGTAYGNSKKTGNIPERVGLSSSVCWRERAEDLRAGK